MIFKAGDRVEIFGVVAEHEQTTTYIPVRVDNGHEIWFNKQSLSPVRDDTEATDEELRTHQSDSDTKLNACLNELNAVDAALKEVTGATRIEKILSVLSILRSQKNSFQNSMMLEDGQIIYGEHLALMAVRNVQKELDDLKRDFQKGLEEERERVKSDLFESITISFGRTK